MPKQTLREQQREATIDAIKTAARQQMTAQGTAAISLRGIARDLSITAPALYRYFASRDDLITALLVDSFNALGDAVAAAEAGHARDDYAGRMSAFTMAYRVWALANPIDFQLIYGNPIPGYVAPVEVTLPAAKRPFDQVVNLLGEALAAGALQPPGDLQKLPPHLAVYLEGMGMHEGYGVPVVVLYIGLFGWTRIHGMIILELLGNTQPVIGDTEAFYRFEVARLCAEMGLKPT